VAATTQREFTKFRNMRDDAPQGNSVPDKCGRAVALEVDRT
jgi:hypothetical protein